jgi:hypothetical protein
VKALLDFLFPPNCLSCSSPTSTKYLCPTCWHTSALPDPLNRCRHCFEELSAKTDLCPDCKGPKALSPYKRAYVFDRFSPAALLPKELHQGLAAFAYLLWIQLEWPDPIALIPMPDPLSQAVALHLAVLLHCPVSRLIRADFSLQEAVLGKEGDLLLLGGHCNPESILSVSSTLSILKDNNISILEIFKSESDF